MNDGVSRLPKGTFLPINRCNLSAQVLGGLTFQRRPAPLYIDGVDVLHRNLLERLGRIHDHESRSRQFADYLDVHFTLNEPEEAGFEEGGNGRPKANWRRILRGWLFDSDSREGAVLKAWVQSRFGLKPRFHKGPIRDEIDDSHLSYMVSCARGLYNTNGLEAQLDLVYTYSQYELALSAPPHLSLYRGINGMEQLEQIGESDNGKPVLLLNNINSFTSDPERASEFGDHIVEIRVPKEKVYCYDALFPDMLQGEREYMVIGGVYEVESMGV